MANTIRRLAAIHFVVWLLAYRAVAQGDDALMFIDPEIKNLIEANAEAKAILGSAHPPEALVPAPPICASPGLLTSEELNTAESALTAFTNETGAQIHLIVATTADLARQSASLVTIKGLHGGEAEVCAFVLDETGRQRACAFSPLMRVRRGGREALQKVLVGVNRSALKGASLKPALLDFVARLQSRLLTPEAPSTSAAADTPSSARTPMDLGIRSPGLSLTEPLKLGVSPSPTPKAVDANVQAKVEDRPTDLTPDAVGRMKRQISSPTPPLAQAPPSVAGFFRGLGRAGWLLLLSVVGVFVPLLWTGISRSIRRMRRSIREKKRFAELRESASGPPPARTLSALGISTNPATVGPYPPVHVAEPPTEDEMAAMRRPKPRSRQAASAQQAARATPLIPEPAPEEAIDRAIWYVQTLRQAPEDLREDILARLEDQLWAIKHPDPVVIRPQRRFEQQAAE